jgi:hypothetical protein
VKRSIAIVVAVWTALAHAQPAATTSDLLREGNTAALAGDWQRVVDLVGPLLQRPLAQADFGEAHRLAGLAAFFRQRSKDADGHFLAYTSSPTCGSIPMAGSTRRCIHRRWSRSSTTSHRATPQRFARVVCTGSRAPGC